jgi:homoserine O-acetyltransferase
MMIASRARTYASAPTNAKSNELFDSIVENGRKTYDANDFLYAFEASRDYDPEPGLGQIKAKLLALNFADDMINAVEIGVVERAIAKIPNARSITLAATERSFGHLNQVHPEIWKSHLLDLLNSLP